MELMIVVVIIGVLVAIAVPLYGNVQQNAKEKACAANVRTISAVAAMYHAERGSFPNDVKDLVNEGYLQDEPVCPLGGSYNVDALTGWVSCTHKDRANE